MGTDKGDCYSYYSKLAANESSYFLKVSLSIISLYCMAGVMTKFSPNIEKLLFILQKDSGPIQHLK